MNSYNKQPTFKRPAKSKTSNNIQPVVVNNAADDYNTFNDGYDPQDNYGYMVQLQQRDSSDSDVSADNWQVSLKYRNEFEPPKPKANNNRKKRKLSKRCLSFDFVDVVPNPQQQLQYSNSKESESLEASEVENEEEMDDFDSDIDKGSSSLSFDESSEQKQIEDIKPVLEQNDDGSLSSFSDGDERSQKSKTNDAQLKVLMKENHRESAKELSSKKTESEIEIIVPTKNKSQQFNNAFQSVQLIQNQNQVLSGNLVRRRTEQMKQDDFINQKLQENATEKENQRYAQQKTIILENESSNEYNLRVSESVEEALIYKEDEILTFQNQCSQDTRLANLERNINYQDKAQNVFHQEFQYRDDDLNDNIDENQDDKVNSEQNINFKTQVSDQILLNDEKENFGLQSNLQNIVNQSMKKQILVEKRWIVLNENLTQIIAMIMNSVVIVCLQLDNVPFKEKNQYFSIACLIFSTLSKGGINLMQKHNMVKQEQNVEDQEKNTEKEEIPLMILKGVNLAAQLMGTKTFYYEPLTRPYLFHANSVSLGLQFLLLIMSFSMKTFGSYIEIFSKLTIILVSFAHSILLQTNMLSTNTVQLVIKDSYLIILMLVMLKIVNQQHKYYRDQIKENKQCLITDYNIQIKKDQEIVKQNYASNLNKYELKTKQQSQDIKKMIGMINQSEKAVTEPDQLKNTNDNTIIQEYQKPLIWKMSKLSLNTVHNIKPPPVLAKNKTEKIITLKETILEQFLQTKENKLNEIKNYLFNFVNKGTMICKITSANIKKGDFQNNQLFKRQSSKSVTNTKIPNLLKTKSKKEKQLENNADANIRKIDLEILVVSDEFFDFLPKVRKNTDSKKKKTRVKNKKQNNLDENSQTSFSKLLRNSSDELGKKLQSGSLLLNSNSRQKSNQTSLNVPQWSIRNTKIENSRLTLEQTQLMEAKIFMPHMISNGMIIHYEKPNPKASLDKLSIMEILQKRKFSSKKHPNKLYFKVMQTEPNERFEEQQTKKKPTENNKSSNSDESLSQKNQGKTLKKPKIDKDESIENLDDESAYQSEVSQFYNKRNNVTIMLKREELTRYYEIEIRQIDKIGNEFQDLTYINIIDVTTILKGQQKFCDSIYQEAIENNYSHEQMTPLNCINSNTLIIKRHVAKLCSIKENINIDIDFKAMSNLVFNEPFLSKFSAESRKLLEFISNVEQSTKSMYYHNTNQIYRMKIKKNQLQLRKTQCKEIIHKIQNVLEPFHYTMQVNQINVYLIRKTNLNYELITDWKSYEMILFNILQNAIKFNQNSGDVVIIMKLNPVKTVSNLRDSVSSINIQSIMDFTPEDTRYFMLETEIIDTGIGISKDRQKLLFIPFQELKSRQGTKQHNNNIGLGLSCSHSITHYLQGDIKLKYSQKGLTSLIFKIPIKIKKIENSQQNISSKNHEIVQIFGKPRILQKHLNQYLIKNSFDVQTFEQSSLVGMQNASSINNHLSQSDNIVSKLDGSIKSNNNALRQSHIFNFNQVESSNNEQIVQEVVQQQKIQIKSNVIGQNKKSESVMNSKQQQIVQQVFEVPKNHVVIKFKSKDVVRSKSYHELERNNSLSDFKQNMNDKRSKSNSIRNIQLDLQQSGLMDIINDSNDNLIESSFQSSTYQISAPYNRNQQLERLIKKQPINMLNREEKLEIANRLVMGSKKNKLARVIQKKQRKNEQLQSMRLPISQMDLNQNLLGIIEENDEENFIIIEQNYEKFDEVFVNDIDINQFNFPKQNQDSSSNQQSDESKENQNISLNSDDIFVINNNQLQPYILEYIGVQQQSHNQGGQRMEKSRRQYINSLQGQNSLQHRNNSLNRQQLLLMGQLSNIDSIEEQKVQSQVSNEQDQSNQLILNKTIAPLKERQQKVAQIDISQINNSDINSSYTDSEEQRESMINDHSQINDQLIDSSSSVDLNNSFQTIKHVKGLQAGNLICECKPKMLIVDDTPFNILAISMVLEEYWNLQADTASNGEIAVQMFKTAFSKSCGCKNRHYRLIWMDIEMPVMNGIEATEEIFRIIKKSKKMKQLGQSLVPQKQNSSNIDFQISELKNKKEEEEEDCFVVFQTSNYSQKSEHACLIAGAKRVISKPVEKEIIEEILDEYFFLKKGK